MSSTHTCVCVCLFVGEVQLYKSLQPWENAVKEGRKEEKDKADSEGYILSFIVESQFCHEVVGV